jgi:hypothetical protein
MPHWKKLVPGLLSMGSELKTEGLEPISQLK